MLQVVSSSLVRPSLGLPPHHSHCFSCLMLLSCSSLCVLSSREHNKPFFKVPSTHPYKLWQPVIRAKKVTVVGTKKDLSNEAKQLCLHKNSPWQQMANIFIYISWSSLWPKLWDLRSLPHFSCTVFSTGECLFLKIKLFQKNKEFQAQNCHFRSLADVSWSISFAQNSTH